MPDNGKDLAAFLNAQKGVPHPSSSGQTQPGPTICKESVERFTHLEHKDKEPGK